MEVLIGADPELFVRKGLYKVSADSLLPGTKEAPVKVDGGAIQVDGTAAEFNIDPAVSSEDFVGKIFLVKGQMEARLKAIDPSYHLEAVPVRFYSRTVWAKIPQQAKVLGCDPDYNAYTGDVNPPPAPPVDGMRSGGGHVHIGWTKDVDPMEPMHMADCRLIVKALDQILFVGSTHWDKDKQRRQIYGRPGAFRPKSYGVEYRVLSNAWVGNPELCRLVYKGARLAADLLDKDSNFAGRMMRIRRFGHAHGVKEISDFLLEVRNAVR